MYKNGDKVFVNVPNSNLRNIECTVIGLQTDLPVVGRIYIVQLEKPHDEEWDAYSVPESYLSVGPELGSIVTE